MRWPFGILHQPLCNMDRRAEAERSFKKKTYMVLGVLAPVEAVSESFSSLARCIHPLAFRSKTVEICYLHKIITST